MMAALDAILVLNAKLAAAEARWQPAQDAVERIEWIMLRELRGSPGGQGLACRDRLRRGKGRRELPLACCD